MIELLVAAPKSPELKIEEVNASLNVVHDLHACMHAPGRPLFARPEGKIVVKVLKQNVSDIEKGVQIGTLGGGFWGILHKTVANWLPKDLDAFYAVQIHESCLDFAKKKGDDPLRGRSC
jgi:hypothetical protein